MEEEVKHRKRSWTKKSNEIQWMQNLIFMAQVELACDPKGKRLR